MDVWQFIRESASTVALLYVTESKGSSPGRTGFAMAVRKSGELHGSIGGGIMEQQLVERARRQLATNDIRPELIRQVHRPGSGEAFSGLICSGEQSVALVFVDPEKLPVESEPNGYYTLSSSGFNYHSELPGGQYWAVIPLTEKNTAYLIGAGHVGLALSRTLSQLDFNIEIFDDRAELNTLAQNTFVSKKHIGNLDDSLRSIPEGDNSYIVAVTFGIDVDRIVLSRLRHKTFRYFGLMGSANKIRILRNEFGPLDAITAPIGINIKSHTPEEIAVSIAAQMIQVKNQSL